MNYLKGNKLELELIYFVCIEKNVSYDNHLTNDSQFDNHEENRNCA
jgi:hypothetical protein